VKLAVLSWTAIVLLFSDLCTHLNELIHLAILFFSKIQLLLDMLLYFTIDKHALNSKTFESHSLFLL